MTMKSLYQLELTRLSREEAQNTLDQSLGEGLVAFDKCDPGIRIITGVWVVLRFGTRFRRGRIEMKDCYRF